MELSELDQRIIDYLCMGLTQKDVAEKLQKEGYAACSLSNIEKKLKKIRELYGAKTNFRLGVIFGRLQGRNHV